ncbi:hypothetical protein [Streptomyces rhizosphaericola]|uniref:hypothetical protein n=1 Tax=Streptomyces rhizosphaericola TaxID=2564098 RepID=UPI003BF50D0A
MVRPETRLVRPETRLVRPETRLVRPGTRQGMCPGARPEIRPYTQLPAHPRADAWRSSA